jgi:predicted deacylase
MTALLQHIHWRPVTIPVGAAARQLWLNVGEVGQGHPVALVTAGVHGDEGPWGAWAIRRLLEQTDREALQGTLRVVPTANPLAMEADARNAPLDTLDLNRVFPGDAAGSHTERLAAALVEHAVNGADVVIDLHGGGSWCVNAFAFQFEGSEALSQAFNPPFLVTAPERSVTLTGYARTQGARIAAVEMGGKSPFEEAWADRIANGLRRALGLAGVLTPLEPIAYTSVPVGDTHVLRPSSGGVFRPRLRADAVGTIVPGGTVLGELLDPYTLEVVETFTAPYERTALLLLRPAITRIEGGAMTYVVAEPLA